MTSSAGTRGLISSGIAAELDDRVAHRGQVDDAWNAGEILQHDARRHEGDFDFGFGLRIPVRDRFDFLGRDIQPVSWRSRFSRRIFIEYGRRPRLKTLAELRQAGDTVALAIDFERVVGREESVMTRILARVFGGD
jgi:hypothetical protein